MLYLNVTGEQRRQRSSGVGGVVKLGFTRQPSFHSAVPNVCHGSAATDSSWQCAADATHRHDDVLTRSCSTVQHPGGRAHPGGVCCSDARIRDCPLSIRAADAASIATAALWHSRSQRETYINAAEYEARRTRAADHRDIWPVTLSLVVLRCFVARSCHWICNWVSTDLESRRINLVRESPVKSGNFIGCQGNWCISSELCACCFEKRKKVKWTKKWKYTFSAC